MQIPYLSFNATSIKMLKFFSCFIILYISLIPQHFSLMAFLSSWATKSSSTREAAKPSCSGFCHVRFFTYLSAANQNKQNHQWHGKGTTKIWENHRFWRNIFCFGQIRLPPVAFRYLSVLFCEKIRSKSSYFIKFSQKNLFINVSSMNLNKNNLWKIRG